MKVYQIDMGYACFGILENEGRVIAAAPIAKWTIGKEIDYVISYYRKKRSLIIGTKESDHGIDKTGGI
jgi:hypothetical protein